MPNVKRRSVSAPWPLVPTGLREDQGDSVPLPPSNRDHALTGDWLGYRECHVKPDLLLIYKKPDDLTLRLARFRSHSELFG